MQHSKWVPKPGESKWREEMEREQAEAKKAKTVKKGKTKRGHRSPGAGYRNTGKWATRQARGGKREEDGQQ